MEIVVSGTRPTGHIHLGNYFGAVKNFVELQHEAQCFFFVADYHSLTTHPNPDDLHDNVRIILSEYLACGLDPEKSTVYVQSDIPEVAELYLILNMFAHKGELERATTFKDKVAKQEKNINAGLLTYPVLQAADIVIHKALKVPVGKDQEQHLEMARTFVNRFNHTFGVDYFPEPQAFSYSKELIKVPGLDGASKMSKSAGEQNTISFYEDEKTIRKKIMRAVTDSGPTQPNSTPPQPIENLFNLMALVSTDDVIAHFKQAYADCSIRYGDLKKQLAEDVVAFTTPFKEKIEAIYHDDALIKRVTAEGAAKARASAQQTLRDVREIIGIRPF
ncbi:MAG: tryptophan--tRNA ligase [Saprospiraceae bacterium]|nr:tryptophan--tRNA ligase [Saprospiraceae bacterium]